MSTYTINHVDDRIAALDGWERSECDGTLCIRKRFKTGNFLTGLGLVTRVAVLAEKADHHPDVTLTYPAVTFVLTTHSDGGVTDKDFTMAEAIDKLSV